MDEHALVPIVDHFVHKLISELHILSQHVGSFLGSLDLGTLRSTYFRYLSIWVKFLFQVLCLVNKYLNTCVPVYLPQIEIY